MVVILLAAARVFARARLLARPGAAGKARLGLPGASGLAWLPGTAGGIGARQVAWNRRRQTR